MQVHSAFAVFFFFFLAHFPLGFGYIDQKAPGKPADSAISLWVAGRLVSNGPKLSIGALSAKLPKEATRRT